MKQSYINCLKNLRNFRRFLKNKKDLKRGKLYFSWLASKTEKIQNEKDERFIYKNIVKYTLKNYDISQYIFDKSSEKIKEIIKNNYTLKNNKYIFNNMNITIEETKLLAKYIIFKRGNVVWINFGFNIGNEFGGMHPAVILKNFDNELFVLPISSKKPLEYQKIEQEYLNNKILLEEYEKQKIEINEIIQFDKIFGFKEMKRWARITRMKKVSMLRVSFSGTIGAVSGEYMESISKKISLEF